MESRVHRVHCKSHHYGVETHGRIGQSEQRRSVDFKAFSFLKGLQSNGLQGLSRRAELGRRNCRNELPFRNLFSETKSWNRQALHSSIERAPFTLPLNARCKRWRPQTQVRVSDGEALPSEKRIHEEPPGAIGWFKWKWAENRAEYHRLRAVLKDLGLAGFLSYGLFNTAYYLVSFLFVWFFVAPSPSGLGVGPAAKRFVKIFAMVWAGSQVTKLLRAGGALLLAPLVDRGLDWFTVKGGFKSKAQAFWAIVGSCFALAVVVFLVIVSLWA